MDNTINYINVEDIIPSKLSPRIDNSDNELDNLAISIQNYGIIQPLLLRHNNGKYEIVLGNRRYKAAVKNGLKQVPAIVLKLNDKEASEYIILDNIQRKQLTEEEKEKIFEEIYIKFKIDKTDLNNNLGLSLNNEIPQSNLLQKEERFESNVLNNQNLTSTNKMIVKGDIVNLKDLDQKELEREDYIMNNEPMNNNIVNTDINNMTGVTQSNNITPTFGGRFFPSLEDEQTNMGFNNGISTPGANNLNTSPLIDLTNLNNEPVIPTNNNPQLEPVPNLGNPTLANLNEPFTDISPAANSAPAPFELPSQDIPVEIPQMEVPVMPQMNIPSVTPMFESQPEIPQMEVPVIPQMDIPSVTPMFESQPEIPQMEVPVMSQMDIPNIAPIVEPQLEIPQMGEPIIPQMDIPNIAPIVEPQPEVSQMESPVEIENNIQPQKDITPAINTIKSLADTLSSLGYKLNVKETDFGPVYNITIDIER